MIASLSGRVSELVIPNAMVVDVGGVGYLVHCPVDLIATTSLGDDVRMSIFTSVREDAITLYGFRSTEDKNWFEALKAAQGVGPSLALTILSSMSKGDLAYAISTSDLAALTRIPGIGSKTASRLMVEMQGRLSQLGAIDTVPGPRSDLDGTIAADLRLALAGLGFGSEQIREVLTKVPANLSLEEMLRFSLKELSA